MLNQKIVHKKVIGLKLKSVSKVPKKNTVLLLQSQVPMVLSVGNSLLTPKTYNSIKKSILQKYLYVKTFCQLSPS